MANHFSCIITEFSSALRMLEVRVPNYTVKDNTVKLECHYDMEDEKLYSIKWYKDGHEFYRYLPRDHPPATLFQQNGITVDLHNSSDSLVVLQSVNLSSSGRYRCEVSGEAPSFNTVDGYGDMIVVVLPETDPRITGGRARYQINDRVNVNCTSGRSKPAVKLTWFINGQHANPEYVKQYRTAKTGREGLEQTILGLRFRVRQEHFKHGDMKLKCLGVIESVYWKSNEESVIGDRQKASTLEVKKQVAATSTSNTRADRVHANSSESLKLSHQMLVSLVVCFIIAMHQSFIQR
ncbi:CLUMA_CG015858, isoform A [Clunio marinus]|uniref:CLUMA_CG015858, isoform A n=1 Tax=Clunio marinus TaxID=568069 RepID=A0A1J1IRE5_9DIPT|nr:CLUMA_CG015858, isoform A [Clunio marinus]